MSEIEKGKDNITKSVRFYLFTGIAAATFCLVLLPFLLYFSYPNQLEVSIFMVLTFFVSLAGYVLSKIQPERTFEIANYEFVFYAVLVGLIIHYVNYLNGPLIFLYGLVILSAAYFVNARNLVYLSGIASFIVLTEYFLLLQNGTVEPSINGIIFVLLRVLYLALLAQVGKSLVINISEQRREYSKLVSLNKQLDEIDHVKGEFVDIASHQLKTPLTVVQGNTSMILDGDYGDVNSNLQMPLKEVDIGAKRLSGIINNVVDTLKYEENLPIHLDKKITDIKDTIKYEIYAFLSESWAKNIKMNLITEGKIPALLVDPEKIKLAVAIYIENAVKHSLRNGKIDILVKNTGKDKIAVEVADNGPQISSEKDKKLFTKPTGKFPRHKGIQEQVGLNLCVVKRIIDSHGGKTYYKNKESGGNVFAFELPIKRVNQKNRKRIR